VWDIGKYEIYDLEGKELEVVVHSQMQQYIEENIYGENYFLFSPSTVREDMYLSISKLKRVRIEKVMPNKLIFFVEVYDSKYGSFLKGERCNILSSEGIVLDSVCEEEGLECCEQYSAENSLIFFFSRRRDFCS